MGGMYLSAYEKNLMPKQKFSPARTHTSREERSIKLRAQTSHANRRIAHRAHLTTRVTSISAMPCEMRTAKETRSPWPLWTKLCSQRGGWAPHTLGCAQQRRQRPNQAAVATHSQLRPV